MITMPDTTPTLSLEHSNQVTSMMARAMAATDTIHHLAVKTAAKNPVSDAPQLAKIRMIT
jgi:hypothetical protein